MTWLRDCSLIALLLAGSLAGLAACGDDGGATSGETSSTGDEAGATGDEPGDTGDEPADAIAGGGADAPTEDADHPTEDADHPTEDAGPQPDVEDVEAPDPFEPTPVLEGLAVDEALPTSGLLGPVSVVRDEHAIPHIYATTAEDLFFVQGFVHAVDRFAEMELLRRVGTGRLGELMYSVDPGTVVDDIKFRVLGFLRVAEQQYANLPQGSFARRSVEAYAAGVSAFIQELRDGTRALPNPYPFFLKADVLADWTPIDTFAIARVQAHDLAFDGYREIALTEQVQSIMDTFPADAADPAIALRNGYMGDVWRFTPADMHSQYAWTPTTTDAMGLVMPVAPQAAGLGLKRPHVPAKLLARGLAAQPSISLFKGDPDARGASNNWAVGPELSATGHPIVCNDPHLALPNPPLFHLSHLHLSADSPDGLIEAAGAQFPGIPGLLIGHNRRVSWVLTTSVDDRSDVYMETYDAAAGTVIVDGEPQPVTVLKDTVKVGNLGTITGEIEIEITLTPQGRVLVPEMSPEGTAPLETGPQLSFAWTGMEATEEFLPVMKALTATSADDILDAFDDFHVANQNIVGGDVDGHIYATSPAHVPIREAGAFTWHPDDNPGGTGPWWILPGDGAADWDGFVPASEGPRTKDPAKGFVVTANEDHFGQILDGHPGNDPVYLGYDYATGFRGGRITRLIDGTGPGSPAAGGAKLGLDAMRDIQADHYSNVAHRLRQPLLAEASRLLEELATPGSHEDLAALGVEYAALAGELSDAAAMLTAWQGWARAGIDDSGGPVDAAEKAEAAATTLWNVWLIRVLARAFGDEEALIGKPAGDMMRISGLHHVLEDAPATQRTWDDAAGQSALWDDLGTEDAVETKGEIIAAAFIDAVVMSGTLFDEGTPLADRVWGDLHRLRVPALLPVPGGIMDLPPPSDPLFGIGYPRGGDQHAVDICAPGYSDLEFVCSRGPVIRLCIDMDPAGPKASIMLPGGQVGAPESPHYADMLPKWLKHEPFPQAFEEAEVRERAQHHTVFAPPQ